MIKHIVLFKLKEDTSREDADALAQDLKQLKNTTDGLMVECDVGLDIMHTENSYNIILNSLFNSTQDLEKYRIHPEHVVVVEKIKELCSSTVKIDYEA